MREFKYLMNEEKKELWVRERQDLVHVLEMRIGEWKKKRA